MEPRTPEMEELLMRKGHVRRMSEALGISRSAIYRWRQVPAERAVAVCEALKLPMSKVRPDLAGR